MPKKKSTRWKTSVFLGSSGQAHFSTKDTKTILGLMAKQGRAIRSAHQALKSGLKDSQLINHLKTLGHDAIGVRYLNSSISQAEQLPLNKKIIFGGKKNWNRLLQGEISKEEWHQLRNNRLFARGDASNHRKGNPLIRISNSQIQVLIPSGPSQKGTWLAGKAKLFHPFPPEAQTCYNVRLIHTKSRTFQIEIAWNSKIEKQESQPGIIGLDTNPNFLAAIDINGDGNPIAKLGISLPRIMFAQKGKRSADIFLAAKEIVTWVKSRKKDLSLESLDFGSRKKRPKGKARNKGFNRMRCNFAYRKLLEAIKRRAHKEGVKIIEVPPGYSSVLGLAKFAKPYNLSRHHAAAIVIARRGMGIKKERQNFIILEKGQPRPEATPSGAAPAAPGRTSQAAKSPVQVRLKPLSISRLRSQYLRGAGLPIHEVHNGRDSRPTNPKRGNNPPPELTQNCRTSSSSHGSLIGREPLINQIQLVQILCPN